MTRHLEPIETSDADPKFRATTIVEAGRQFPEPAAFAVTLEPAGGVPQPTGDKVLVGLVGL